MLLVPFINYWLIIDTTAFEASDPFFILALACFILRHVSIPLPIGFLLSTARYIIAFVEAYEMKSKCGVWPFITHPKAIKPSYFLIFFDIVTGISNTPGTLTILIEKEFLSFDFADFKSPFEISL